MSHLDDASAGKAGRRLRPNSIGIVAAATLGLIFMSPAGAYYTTWGGVASESGGPAPFIYIVALLAIIPTTLSYAFVAKRVPSAGSAYAWIGSLTNRHVGDWLGWMMLPYYVLIILGPPALLGLFFNGFLNDIGLHVSPTNYWTIALALIVTYGIAGALGFYGIETSSRAATAIVAFEAAVIIALVTTILVRHSSQATLQPFNPAAGHLTFKAFWLAMPLAFYAFVGFDVVSTVSEETKLPRKAIPRATIVAVLLFTVFLVYTSYASSYAVPFRQLVNLTSSGLTPVTAISKQYWGQASFLISLTGVSAGLGSTLAILVSASRIVYAMARSHALPAPFARLSDRANVPAIAMAAILTFGVVADLVLTATLGALYTVFWVSTATVYFALVTYIAVNFGNFWLHYRQPGSMDPLRHVIVPALGALLCAAVLYYSFFKALWAAGWVTIGRGIVVFALGWTLSAFIYAFVVRKKSTVPTARAMDAMESEDATSHSSASSGDVAPTFGD